MDRREFIKTSAIAAVVGATAGAGIASPIASAMAKDNNDNAKLKDMKVLLINGSPRKEGNTHVALTEAAKQLEKHGIATEMIEIGTKPMHGCIACNHCNETGHCVFNDDLCNRAIDLMAECDGIIVGSPTYYGQPNGTVLSLVQRMSYAGSHVMQNKPAAAVAVCRRGGASAVYQTMLLPFEMQNMPIVTSQYWNIIYGRAEGEAALDTEGLQTMRTMADNMAWLLKKIHTGAPDYPEREPWQGMHFIR